MPPAWIFWLLTWGNQKIERKSNILEKFEKSMKFFFENEVLSSVYGVVFRSSSTVSALLGFIVYHLLFTMSSSSLVSVDTMSSNCWQFLICRSMTLVCFLTSAFWCLNFWKESLLFSVFGVGWLWLIFILSESFLFRVKWRTGAGDVVFFKAYFEFSAFLSLLSLPNNQC